MRSVLWRLSRRQKTATAAAAAVLEHCWPTHKAISATHQHTILVTEAGAHAKLGDTLRTVETALVLHHYTRIKVPFVDKCVHNALLAIVDFYGTNMPACHHNDRRASLAGMAIIGQI